MLQLGSFDTAEEAALAYARHVGKERAAAEAAAAAAAERVMAARARAEEARAAASREGLELVPSNNACGFRGVDRDRGKFEARGREGGKER